MLLVIMMMTSTMDSMMMMMVISPSPVSRWIPVVETWKPASCQHSSLPDHLLHRSPVISTMMTMTMTMIKGCHMSTFKSSRSKIFSITCGPGFINLKAHQSTAKPACLRFNYCDGNIDDNDNDAAVTKDLRKRSTLTRLKLQVESRLRGWVSLIIIVIIIITVIIIVLIVIVIIILNSCLLPSSIVISPTFPCQIPHP